jgi:hypothetical protein
MTITPSDAALGIGILCGIIFLVTSIDQICREIRIYYEKKENNGSRNDSGSE